jgi:hypothetical protein
MARHAVGLSWKTRPSQLVLAAVRPLWRGLRGHARRPQTLLHIVRQRRRDLQRAYRILHEAAYGACKQRRLVTITRMMKPLATPDCREIAAACCRNCSRLAAAASSSTSAMA